jgi:CheY-like chemotaxis protein
LVEDNQVNLRVGQALLHKLGYAVHMVESGEAAIEALRDDPSLALVLMDVQMPGLDGYSATRIIRSTGNNLANPQIPIIAMTANVMPGDREMCLDAGMNDFIAKPVHLDELSTVLERWLSNS